MNPRECKLDMNTGLIPKAWNRLYGSLQDSFYLLFQSESGFPPPINMADCYWIVPPTFQGFLKSQFHSNDAISFNALVRKVHHLRLRDWSGFIKRQIGVCTCYPSDFWKSHLIN